jgi:membrane protein implicated in regulation of membrane protease activity
MRRRKYDPIGNGFGYALVAGAIAAVMAAITYAGHVGFSYMFAVFIVLAVIQSVVATRLLNRPRADTRPTQHRSRHD